MFTYCDKADKRTTAAVNWITSCRVGTWLLPCLQEERKARLKDQYKSCKLRARTVFRYIKKALPAAKVGFGRRGI
jgi:hypothetical protein